MWNPFVRVEIATAEPHYGDQVQLEIEITTDRRRRGYQQILPAEYFKSHFDRIMETAVAHLKKACLDDQAKAGKPLEPATEHVPLWE